MKSRSSSSLSESSRSRSRHRDDDGESMKKSSRAKKAARDDKKTGTRTDSSDSESSRSRSRGSDSRQKTKKRNDDDDDDKDDDKKKNKNKKEKRSSQDEKGDKKKSKKDKKKSKKSKKDKKKNKKSKGNDAESEKKPYGYYGIIGREHYQLKREEFYLWMQEVKHLNIDLVSQVEEKRYYEEFCEDYNMAILPQKKYYDYKLWESKQLQTKRVNPESILGDAGHVFNDEGELEKQRKFRKAFIEQQQLMSTMQAIAESSKIRDDMQSQSRQQTLMQLSYKSGDLNTAKQLHKKLNPTKEDGTGR